jgi:autotransporter-associated beta strand protein
LAQSSPRSGLSSAWLGNISVTSGSLKIGNGGSSGFLPGYDPIAYAGLPPTVPTISLAGGATLEFNHAAGGPTQDTAHAVVISGPGNVVVSGAKTEVFVANNTYTGNTTINSGSSLRIGWGGTFNTGGLGATAIANSGALTFSNDHNTTFPGSISGAGTLLKEYNGKLTLTGAAAHTGGTTVATGTLEVGNGGTTGSISGAIINNANLSFNRSDNTTHSGVVSGTGAVEQRGAGTLTLSGANTYSGGTTVSNGALQVSSDGNLGAVPGSFTSGDITLDGGALRFGANFDLSNNRGIALGAAGGTIDTQGFTNPSGYTQANGISGGGNLTKIGSGTFFMNTPSGQLNTGWTGNLILREGTWKINERGGLPFNPPQTPGSPVITDQITFDGGTLQIAAAIPNVTNGRRGITVAAGGGTIDTQGFTFNWAGPLAGDDTAAVLTKTGNGTLQLNTNSVPAPSTYAGNVIVAQGTLVINGGAAMGDLAAIDLTDASGVLLTISGASETIGSLAGGGAAGGNVTLNTSLTTGGNNTSTTYAGVISGPGGLTKIGSGAFKLTGSNSYEGLTTVASGTLSVDGAIPGDTIVQNGATLAGAGTIGGTASVQSGGILAPGTSVGTINVGTLTMAGGSILGMEIGSTSDQVVVGGAATLGGTLAVSFAEGFIPVVGQTFTLLTASTRTGTFVEALPSFGNLTLDVTYDAQNVLVEVVPILPGDFNADGAVNAADYIVLRKGGSGFTQSDYDDWRRHFGETLPEGASQSEDFSNVPEPFGGVLMSIAIFLLFGKRSLSL